jgi:hypothetical protein
MVATRAEDKLNYIFIKDLTPSSVEEDKLKAQRLNVGLSRAKEKMWFILSKPVDEFHDGSIKVALSHYKNILDKGVEMAAVDPNSPMETKVLHWLTSCKFYLDNQEYIELIPQFDIGSYLKQLDSTYHHAKYKVDFLFIYKRN